MVMFCLSGCLFLLFLCLDPLCLRLASACLLDPWSLMHPSWGSLYQASSSVKMYLEIFLLLVFALFRLEVQTGKGSWEERWFPIDHRVDLMLMHVHCKTMTTNKLNTVSSVIHFYYIMSYSNCRSIKISYR